MTSTRVSAALTFPVSLPVVRSATVSTWRGCLFCTNVLVDSY
jgi:hypothetical protein